jgi:thymidylate kinase
VLPKIRDLIERMNDAGVRYCHWKSNWNLPSTLEGQTDLDLLVHRRDARRFRDILRDLSFGPAVEAGTPSLPAIEHYHALDETTDRIAHVHAYYRVISGESLAKNYHFPVEEMLLTNTRQEGMVVVPSAGAELIVFVLRMLVKHTTPIELGLFMRGWESFRREADWLMTPSARDEGLSLLPVWLPQIDETLFVAAYDALRQPAPTSRRIALGFRVRSRLRGLTRHHPTRARLAEVQKFTTRTGHRLAGTKKKLAPGNGGLVIAFVGPEASGKSTVLGELERWLGAHYTVRHVHAGKPPATALTLIPHALLPLLRALIPEQRSTRVASEDRQPADPPGQQASYPLAFALRSVMLAYERRAVLARAFARASNGTIVLCDRYPPAAAGAPDGVQLAHRPGTHDPVRRWLCALETRIYADIPSPDLVIQLTAPLDVTLARNAARTKTEPEPYVRWRHRLTESLAFDRAPVHKLNTDRPLDEVMRDAKQAIWDAL